MGLYGLTTDPEAAMNPQQLLRSQAFKTLQERDGAFVIPNDGTTSYAGQALPSDQPNNLFKG